MTRRCSDCGISYPISIVECMVCAEPTDPFNNASPDLDWRDKVNHAKTKDVDWEDQVPRWRFAQLIRAGYAPREAEALAARTSHEVDLHRAVDLARKAGPALAFEILN